MVQLSLLSVGIIYDAYSKLGTKPDSNNDATLMYRDDSEMLDGKCCCRRCNISMGMLHGHVLFISSIADSVLFGLLREGTITWSLLPDDAYRSIFYSISSVFTILCLLLTVRAMVCSPKLHYLKDSQTLSFSDLVLLNVSLGATFVLLLFLLVGTIFLISTIEFKIMFAFYMLYCILTWIQASLQTILIHDARHRRLVFLEHFKSKPGRASIAFLMMTNLALWVFLSFQSISIIGAKDLINFYGTVPWLIICNILLPLTTFYRFHAGACFAEIYENTYYEMCYLTGKSRVKKYISGEETDKLE